MKNPFIYIKPFVVKHEPEILMGMGITGMIFSTVWGIKATVKATKKVLEYKESKNINKVTTKEVIKLTWKYYWPVATSMVLSIPLIIAGNRVSNKRYAALATAYTISETALLEYQEKTREVVGEKKAREIQEGIDGDRIQKTYTGTNQIIMTGYGESLFYEPLSGRYFKSNWNDIAKAANELNASALDSLCGQITLNEWFDKLGLESTEVGDGMGWETNGSRPYCLLDISISSHINKDNVPCGAISYRQNPVKLKDSIY